MLQLPWAHNCLLIQKAKSHATRPWYLKKAVEQGWSRDTLAVMLKNQAHLRQGTKVNNFPEHLPVAQSELAMEPLKDPYVFDFLTLTNPFKERELEAALVQHLEKFLLELGRGFAFVGRQVHLEVGENEFYIDLLFYHLKLRCFVVIDLKRGPFLPEHAGKMNFYLEVVNERFRHESDQPSVGMILWPGPEQNRGRVCPQKCQQTHRGV